MEQSFNTNLRMLRKQKGLTQEQLADAVGVSAQAVSKWELSSFPDAQLLPAVADCLGVTIDELFGRKKEETPDIYTQIADHLRSIPVENRFQEAFQLCWLICQSSDDFLNLDPSDESFLDNNEISLYSETTNNHGFLQARLNRSLQYFLLMPEPEGGFDHFYSIMTTMYSSLKRLHSQMLCAPFIFSPVNIIQICSARKSPMLSFSRSRRSLMRFP